MANNTKLQSAAVKIGTVAGRADRTAHKVAKAAQLARQELAELAKQVEVLKRQLERSSKRLRRALQ